METMYFLVDLLEILIKIPFILWFKVIKQLLKHQILQLKQLKTWINPCNNLKHCLVL